MIFFRANDARPIAWSLAIGLTLVVRNLAMPAAWGEPPLVNDPAAADKPDDNRAKQAAERDKAALGWILKRGLRAIVPVPAPQVDIVEAEVPQLQQQVDLHAKQLERQFESVLASELEMIRLACGDLSPPARKGILKAGQEAQVKAARDMANRRMRGQWNNEEVDPRQQIRSAVATALRSVAAPEQVAAYEREQAARTSRQSHAARLRIVAQLDQQLDLSSAQRKAIEEDLVAKWKPGWLVGLAESGMINDLPIAPDFAAAAIEPHLAGAQKETWNQWSRMAGSNMVGQHFITWNFDGSGLQGTDDWWKQ